MCWLSCADAVSHDVPWSAHKPALWALRNESVATTPVAMARSSFFKCTGYGSLVHLGGSAHPAYGLTWPLVSATGMVGLWNDWSLMVYLNWVLACLVRIASLFGYLVDLWELARRFSFWLFEDPPKRSWQARRCSSHRLKQPFGWRCKHHRRCTLSVGRSFPCDFSSPLKSAPWVFLLLVGFGVLWVPEFASGHVATLGHMSGIEISNGVLMKLPYKEN